MTENIECRLCGGSAKLVFQKIILYKHQVGYYQCGSCGSLETESPFWLSEAYDPLNERFDTGQLIRSFDNAAFVAVLISYLGLEKSRVVNYGCGSGAFGAGVALSIPPLVSFMGGGISDMRALEGWMEVNLIRIRVWGTPDIRIYGDILSESATTLSNSIRQNFP